MSKSKKITAMPLISTSVILMTRQYKEKSAEKILYQSKRFTHIKMVANAVKFLMTFLSEKVMDSDSAKVSKTRAAFKNVVII